MEDWAYLHQLHGGQIEALLGVKELSDVVLREEIPKERLKEALRGLSKKKRPYDKILFESDGKIDIVSLRMSYQLPFEMVALSYQNKHFLTDFLVIQTINRTHYLDRENRPPIYVRNPRFWSYNSDEKRNPTNEESNNLRINFGRLFNSIELIVRAKWDLESKELRTEEGPRLYKIPTAVGYKLK
ncbi:hypothetical protein HY636_06395 [Candidatus Woesearchaeota archaeon]|nr:hypothetical protein [Candidatus Woesearchaeota archaeon]